MTAIQQKVFYYVCIICRVRRCSNVYVWICDSFDDQTVEEVCDDGNTAEGVLLCAYYVE